MKIKILVPIYNDWQSVSKLIDEINNLSISSEYEISTIIVNDASNHDRLEENKDLSNIHSYKIINMKKNQGHARCIAVGLKYIFEKSEVTTTDTSNEITSNYKEMIITNRWISGLSLVSVFVIVSLIYSKIGINMSFTN